jgi:hypothetical protein
MTIKRYVVPRHVEADFPALPALVPELRLHLRRSR